jgi:hypothetical protein
VTTTAEPVTTPIEVGTVIDTTARRDALMPGTVLEVTGEHQRGFDVIPRYEVGMEGGLRVIRRTVPSSTAGHSLASLRTDGYLAVIELPTEEQSRPPVGTAITERSVIATLPVGTVIRYDRAGEPWRYRKVGTGEWLQFEGRDSGLHDETHFTLSGGNVIESYPDEQVEVVEYDGPQVGHMFRSADEYRAIPVGTVVRGTYTYTKVDAETFVRSDNGRNVPLRNMGRRGNIRLVSLGAPSSVTEPTENRTPGALIPVEQAAPTETFEQYLVRFRDAVLGQATSSGVGLDPVLEACRALGVPEESMYVGLEFRAGARIANSLPNGSVVRREGGTMFAKFGGSWRRVVGQYHWDGMLTVVRGPGLPSEAPAGLEDREATVEDVDRINEFKRRAWRLGAKVKIERSYCGDYERAMRAADIDGTRITTGARVVTAEEAASLPVGSVLRYQDPAYERRTRLYVRDDSAENPAKTRSIGGSLTGDWHPTMRVEHLPDWRELLLPVKSFHEMNDVPVGSQMRDSTVTWTKCRDGRWSPRNDVVATGTYEPSAFSLGSLFITRIGEGEEQIAPVRPPAVEGEAS